MLPSPHIPDDMPAGMLLLQVYTVSDLVKPITGELSIKLRSISDDSSSCAAAARRSQASEASAAVASAYAHGRSQGTAGLLSSEVAADEKVAGDLAVKIVPLGSAEVWKESIYTLQNMPGCKQGECYVEVSERGVTCRTAACCLCILSMLVGACVRASSAC